MITRLSAGLLSIATMLGAAEVHSVDYPVKPIHVLVNPVGGAPDFVARLIAQALPVSIGQQLIVDNRPAPIAIDFVAKAPPDGYTIVVTGSALWLLPFLRDNVPWDTLKDFSPISEAISSPTILVVNPAFPAKSVKELIAAAKAKPGSINYASTETGTIPHIAAELFKAMTGTNITRVAYKGAGPGLIAIAAGEVQLAFATTSSVMPHIKSGRLRALAVTSAKPSTLVPGLPTVAETVPGYEAASIIGVFAPAKTPDAIINQLNREIGRVLAQQDVKDKVFNTGAETVGGPPSTLAATVKAEMTRLGKVIKDQGIREE